MRITNNMLVSNMINYITTNQTRMSKYQQQLATGKKVVMPSDDPVVASRSLKLRTDVAEIQQYSTNVKDAQSWLDTTESSLGDMGDILQRARELAVEGSNGTNTTDDMQKIASEVQQLRTQMIHLGNATYAGRYIFSGYSTDKPLLNDDGTFAINVNTYNDPSTTPPGYREDIKYEIGIGDNININVLGGDLFNSGGNARVAPSAGVAMSGAFSNPAAPINLTGSNQLHLVVDGTHDITVNLNNNYANLNALVTDLNTNYPALTGVATASVANGMLKFTSATTGNGSSVVIDTAAATSPAATVLNMSLPTQVNGADNEGTLIKDFDNFITALNNGDHTAVSNILAKFDTDMNNILRVRSDVGARQNRVDLTSNRLSNDNTNFTKLMSDNEDVDMADTIMNLTNEENVYRASLAGGARIIQTSLVDFLR